MIEINNRGPEPGSRIGSTPSRSTGRIASFVELRPEVTTGVAVRAIPRFSAGSAAYGGRDVPVVAPHRTRRPREDDDPRREQRGRAGAR
ncbi:hypothetical protein ES5_15158 [Dietzia cinnamea P4]|nr:hypothetical protein ES5_15158 [Dietzia cinnamea P4]